MHSPVNLLYALVLPVLTLVAAIAVPAQGTAEVRLTLLMLDAPGCVWCARWDAEVAGAYGMTEEGRRAPLRRQPIAAPLPGGIELARPARFTPTFVLLGDGAEIGRIEGYPGEAFFYGLLQDLIARADAPETRGRRE